MLRNNPIPNPIGTDGKYGKIFPMISKVTPPEFLEWLDAALRTKGQSDSEASRKAGLSHSAIYEIRSGVRPGLAKCRALAQLFGYQEEYVLRLAGHLPPIVDQDNLSPQIAADLDQIRRYIEMLPPDAREQVTSHLVEMARLFVDIRQPGTDTSAA